MPQTLKISSPLKGVNRAFGREAQPPNTCFDALNVMPSDRYGRLRIAQRTGIGELATLSANNPIRLLHVASSVNTTLGTSTVTLLDELFTYANGSLGSHTTVWRTYKADNGGELGLLNMADWTETANAFVIASNKITSGTTYLQTAAVSQTALTLGANYDISLDFVVGASEPTMDIAIIAGIDVASHTPDGTCLTAAIATANGGGIQVFTVSDNFTTDQPTVASVIGLNTTHTLKMQVRGTTVTLFLDGVQQAQITGASIPASQGVGIFCDGTSGTSDLITMDNFIVSQSVTTSIDRTTLQLVATSDTDTYVGTPIAMTAATASASHPIDATSLFISAATLFGYTYIVDGNSKPKRLRLSDNTMIAFTESAGTAPSGCTLACNWRGRLVLSGATADPQNFFCSKAGDPLNWDYGDGTPTSAFAGNDSEAGLIGQPIHALIPVSDDLLVVGCEQSMWCMRGDPADGGSITCITDFAGISQANSWTKAADGSIYFVGPRGFFKMDAAATRAEEISKLAYPQFFQQVNRATNFISCIYDADRYGVWVFICPITQGDTATSLFYDLRVEGYWPQTFATQLNAGPLCAVWWDGFTSDTRYPILGGFDGITYAFNSTNRTDNGGTISSYLLLGPIHPSDVESTLIGTTVNQGELSTADLATPSRWNEDFTLYAGSSAYSVTEGTTNASAKGVITWGSQGSTKTMRQRLRGEWFSLLLSNSAASNYFSFESVDMEFNTAGRNRRQGL